MPPLFFTGRDKIRQKHIKYLVLNIVKLAYRRPHIRTIYKLFSILQ